MSRSASKNKAYITYLLFEVKTAFGIRQLICPPKSNIFSNNTGSAFP